MKTRKMLPGMRQKTNELYLFSYSHYDFPRLNSMYNIFTNDF